MTIYYSKITGGFYDSAIHSADQIPADAVTITDGQHQKLLAGQQSGQIITADANGEPINAAPPPLTPAQQWTAYQAAAQAQLDENDRVAIRCWKAGVAYPTDWRANDVTLRAIVSATSGDPSKPLPPPPSYPAGT